MENGERRENGERERGKRENISIKRLKKKKNWSVAYSNMMKMKKGNRK